jgi:hypothetical protein
MCYSRRPCLKAPRSSLLTKSSVPVSFQNALLLAVLHLWNAEQGADIPPSTSGTS